MAPDSRTSLPLNCPKCGSKLAFHNSRVELDPGGKPETIQGLPLRPARRIEKLFDITQDDCRMVEQGMTECSRWMRGHDESVADGTPVPSPAELQKRIAELEAWAKAIKSRRN
jgi:hypothetical protein